ncbi:O-antigen ligase family protein [Planomonospora sp. ID82291]|nr:O-antigen ligase family protein [Planomonospora sp. ID82291]
MADGAAAGAVRRAAGIAARRGPGVLAAAVVLCVCVPVRRDDPASAFHATPADLASVALVAAAAVSLLAGGRRLPVRVLVLVPPVVAACAATMASHDVMASLPGLVRYLQVFVLVPLAVAVALRDRAALRLTGGAVVGAALLQGAVGCLQALTGTGASYAGENVRAVGTFGAQDVMGMATVVSHGLVVLLGLGLALRGRGRAAALLGAALLLPPLVLSLSRGAWLATACAAAVMAALSGRRTAAGAGLLAVTAAALLAAGSAAGPAGPTGAQTVGRRLASIGASVTEPDRSVSDRYDLWRTAAGIWRDHPLTGTGPRGFPAFRDAHAPLRLSSGSDTADPVSGFRRQPLLSPHNMYLLVLSEQGLAGIAAFCLLPGSLALWSVRRLRRIPRARPARLAHRARPARPARLVHRIRPVRLGVRPVRLGVRPPYPRSGPFPPDRALGLVATGFLTWQLVDFAYSDIGGAPTLVMSVMLGAALRWASAGAPAGSLPAAPGRRR